MIKVEGISNNKFFDVTKGKEAEIIGEFWYNGEGWYSLRTKDGDEFASPACFWKQI